MNPNLPRVLTLLHTWKETLHTTKKAVIASKEEAENQGYKGTSVVLGEVEKLLQNASDETHRIDTFLSHGASSTDPILHESLDKLSHTLEQMDLLVLNSRVESARIQDVGRKYFTVVTNELEELLSSLSDILTEINSLWGNAKEKTIEEQMFQHLQKAANRVNLLSLNNSIEAARSGKSGATFIVFSEELRKMAHMIQHATTQLEKNYAKKKAE